MLRKLLMFSVVLVLGASASAASANHSWGGYHWARTANPLALKLGDNVSSAWDIYLRNASADWSTATVLDTSVVAGLSNPKNCKAVPGRVEVCNSKYGNNGWLGIAQIWISGDHITQAVTKMNDTYFSRAYYNTPAWRQFVICQEIGHTFGLDHQDENFSNLNLGTCMDYTSDPDGSLLGQLSNEHPNQHDYDELALIYDHLDSTNTASSTVASSNAAADLSDPSAWGKAIRESSDKKTSVFERDFGKGEKAFTFVTWVQE